MIIRVISRVRPMAGPALVAVLLAACSGAGVPPGASAPASGAAVPSAAASVAPSAAARADCPEDAPPPLPAGETRTVTVETALGAIVVKVDGSLAPNAAGNFVALASCGFYDDVVFHRLVPGFVIQGGDGEFGRSSTFDPQRIGTGGPGYTILDQEVKGEYKRGTIAMARTSAPNSQGSQFFIVLTDDPAGPILESYRTYAIFGEVIDGMDVVDRIAAMPNGGDETGNQAVDPVPMIRLTVSAP